MDERTWRKREGNVSGDRVRRGGRGLSENSLPNAAFAFSRRRLCSKKGASF
jgi:hypothetical protein